jgi:hypothetical protein
MGKSSTGVRRIERLCEDMNGCPVRMNNTYRDARRLLRKTAWETTHIAFFDESLARMYETKSWER